MIKTKEIEGRVCHIAENSSHGPYIYWGIQPSDANEIEQMTKLIDQYSNRKPYHLIAYESRDWNGDFSPWQAPAVYGKEDFPGNALRTYRWLTEACTPSIEGNGESEKGKVRLLAGYSLAGLFSLWAFYQKNIFSGAVSCSGSFWYPGWLSFVEQSKAWEDSVVYLSLGTKEEKTKNRMMATVGDAARQMEELLREDPNVMHSVLEWNPGGHFQEPMSRMAKGIAWALQWF